MLIREAESEDTGVVIALARRAKQTVGFLPDSAFTERAQRGTLLVALIDDRIVGYLLHDLPRDEIKVVHLVVDAAGRGEGVARALIDEVARRYPSRRGISLNCRNDYPAHTLWPVLGFTPMGERGGRSLDGKPLTRWWKSFGHTDLLTLLDAADERPTAVLDSCVFFDVVADDAPDVAQQLRSDWLGDHVRIAISSEVRVEISQGNDRARRDRQYAAAQTVPVVDPTEPEWRPVHEAICDRLPDEHRSDEGDIRQVARAIASGASWFVTTDTTLRARYSETAELLGDMKVLSPAEFLREVDELARGESYRPVDLLGTAVTNREADAVSMPGLAERFVNHADGETIRQLRARVGRVASKPRTYQVRLIEVDSEPRALVSIRAEQETLEASILRIVGGRAAGVLARHLLLAWLRSEAERQGLDVVRVTDPFVSRAVREQLSKEGFLATEGGAVAAVLCGVGTSADLVEAVEQLPLERNEMDSLLSVAKSTNTPSDAARAEAWFAPYRIMGSGLPTFVVPIKATWAAPLFDVGLADAQLFPRDWELGLRRELAYYRSPRNGGGIAAPGRILWYVTASQHEYGVQSIRALSSLSEVVVREVKHLWYRNRRLGVYDLSDIEKASSGGRAMALRFSTTELLVNPVALDDYREIATGSRKSTSVVLQSPQRVDEHMFAEILARGRADVV